MTDKQNLCIDCRWHDWSRRDHRCVRPDSKNLVTGKCEESCYSERAETKTGYYYGSFYIPSDLERMEKQDRCGPEGKYFEQLNEL